MRRATHRIGEGDIEPGRHRVETDSGITHAQKHGSQRGHPHRSQQRGCVGCSDRFARAVILSLRAPIRQTAPTLLKVYGVGYDTAAKLLVTAETIRSRPQRRQLPAQRQTRGGDRRRRPPLERAVFDRR
jgi:hypothetical protein